MVNIYDKANELAALLKQDETYLAYKKTKEEVYAEEANKKMIGDYKKLQFEAQAAMMSGQEPDAELMDKIQKMGEVLQFNPKITEFFAAEYKFQTLMADLYKIIFADVSDFGETLAAE